MICKNCGAQNPDDAFICVNCASRFDDSQRQQSNNTQQNNAQPNNQYNYGYNNQGQSANGNFSQQYNAQNGQNGQYANGYNNQNNGNTFNYNQSYNYTPLNNDFVKKGSIIAALVIGVITQNWIAVVLAVIALIYCSDFENTVRTGNFQLADQKRASIAKLRKWAWILCIISIVIAVVSAIVSIVIFGVGFFDFFDTALDDSYYYDEFYEFSQMAKQLFLTR